jgi:hypothetical protein
MTFPFPAFLPGSKIWAEGGVISPGTIFGTLTKFGGLAAAFDGATNTGSTGCAVEPTTDNYIGLSIQKRLWRVDCYGSNNSGYTLVDGTVTIYLYGKQGAAPGSATDGTLLGSISFADAANESSPRTIYSNAPATLWDHIWVRIVTPYNCYVAELKFYEAV